MSTWTDVSTPCKAIAVALALAAGFSSTAEAAGPSCIPLSIRNQRSDIEAFKREPARFLVYLGGSFPKIEGFVANFIASDPDMLVPLKQFIARANAEERRSVGIGLANAAERCTRSQPAVSYEITKYVGKLNDPAVSAGFLSQSPATKAGLPPPARQKPAGEQLLLEGEDGNKLVDPFAAVPLSR